MFSRLGIRHSLYLGAGASILLMLLFTAAIIYSLKLGPRALTTVYEQAVVPMSTLMNMEGMLKEVRFRMAAYVLDQMPPVGNKIQLQEARAALPTVWREFKEMIKHRAHTEEERALITQIDSQLAAANPFFNKLENAYVGDDKKLAARLLEDEWPIVHKDILKPLGLLVQVQQAAVKTTYESTAKSGQRVLTSTLIVLPIVIVVLVILTMGLIQIILRPINKAVSIASTIAGGDLGTQIVVGSEKTETGQLIKALKTMSDNLLRVVKDVRFGSESILVATAELAAGSTNLSARTEEQAASLEETASSMEELTSTVKQNAENSRQAAQLANNASSIATKGGDLVGNVVTTMGRIQESSQKIGHIIGVIEGIAFQTNILALNAAVEAARAGEEGRGFGVVAGEVRNLAQRSAQAAKEIKGLIDDSVDKVSDGTKLVQETGRTMDAIVSSIKRVSDIIGEIAAASDEQSSGIEQVNQAVVQMDTVTQQNAALVEEAAAAGGALEQQARKLNELVSVFKLGSHESEIRTPAVVRESTTKITHLPLKAQRAPLRKAVAANAHLAAVDDHWKEF